MSGIATNAGMLIAPGSASARGPVDESAPRRRVAAPWWPARSSADAMASAATRAPLKSSAERAWNRFERSLILVTGWDEFVWERPGLPLHPTNLTVATEPGTAPDFALGMHRLATVPDPSDQIGPYGPVFRGLHMGHGAHASCDPGALLKGYAVR